MSDWLRCRNCRRRAELPDWTDLKTVSLQAERKAIVKRWAARLTLAIAAPITVLVLLELLLRVTGFGYPTSFFLKRAEHGGETLVQNNKFGWRFFGRRMARLPHPLSLGVPKSTGTIRIVVLGESAAFGDPQPAFGLPRMLEATLELRHPGAKFEIVNAAMTGINSHTIVPIARACARADADVWVVYMGNNEVVGPFGAGTVFGAQVPPLPIIRANLALKTMRVGQALDALRESLQKAPPEKSEWGGMMMFMDQKVAATDPRMTRVYGNFEKNLSDVIQAGRDAGAAVIVSTIAVNLRDCAPFASLHRKDLGTEQLSQWENLFKRGAEAQGLGRWREASTALEAAARIDDTYAELRYRLGECELALGESEKARMQFIAARDLDALRFRCDSRLNESIRRQVEHGEIPGVLFADGEKALEQASPNGLPGTEIFYEHVHLTFEGNYRLARVLAEQVEKCLSHQLRGSTRPWPEINDCARRLAWAGRSQQLAISEILGRLDDPPFTFQIEHEAQKERLANVARKLPAVDSQQSLRQAQDACETVVASWPGDALVWQQVAEIKQALADYAAAAAAAKRSLDLLPSSSPCWLVLGLALAHEQKFEDAAGAFRRVFELDPDDVWGRQNLAICWQKLGRRDDAIREFKQALAIKPRFLLAWLGLGRIYEEMGRKDEAQKCFEKALANPIHRADEMTTLARFCQSRGWYEAAATNYASAITLSPADARLHVEAGQVLAALGRHADAAQRYAEAIRLSPDQGQTHFLRGAELGKLGRPVEAEVEFREAARLLPDVLEAQLNVAIALYQQQKLESALAEFQTVLQRSPSNALALRYAQAIREKLSAGDAPAH
jgi:tetratricopeptide (TPR) repeat protein